MTPTPEPQSMGGNLAEPQQAAQGAEKSKKKRKRLTKAADIAEVAEGGHGDGSAAGLQKKLQVRHNIPAEEMAATAPLNMLPTQCMMHCSARLNNLFMSASAI